MKKFNWLLLALLFIAVPVLQSCDNDDNEAFGIDWATVHTTGGGGYYLQGDNWGKIGIASSNAWFKPIDGERVIAFFKPLSDKLEGYNIAVQMDGAQSVLTKKVEDLTAENDAEYGNDPIVIYEGYMWLGGDYLNLVFKQRIPRTEKHRISLVRNVAEPFVEDGYVHLELRYNTYKDTTNDWQFSPVSYNLSEFYPKEGEDSNFKGFKVKINSKENGERTLILDPKHPVAVPEDAKNAHMSTTTIR